jgi:hypothetical protein
LERQGADDFLADVAEEEADAVPFAAEIEVPPEAELSSGAQFYLDAFHDLCGDRAFGALGGEGPIPWSAIDAWARRNKVGDEDEFEFLRTMIREMDAEYLDVRGEQAKVEAERLKQEAKNR